MREKPQRGSQTLFQPNRRRPYVYCPSGLWATVFWLAEQENWTEAECLAKFQTVELVPNPDCPLGTFAHAWFPEKS